MATDDKPAPKTTKMRLLNWFRWSSQDRYPNTFVLLCFMLAFGAGAVAGYEIAYVHWWNGFSAIAPQIVTVAGGAIAGTVALWQYNRSHQQRDVQFRKKELQDQFVDIQDRLAAPEAIISANAALRLAEFGKTQGPETQSGDQHSVTNNPYFLPAASQLATALYLEPRTEVRKTVLEAIRSLIVFGADGAKQPLLLGLIERLVSANRAAKEVFIRAMAEHAVSSSFASDSVKRAKRKKYVPNESELNFISSLAPFCFWISETRTCLTSLMLSGEERDDEGNIVRESDYVVHCRTYDETLSKMVYDERVGVMAGTFPKLRETAQKAIDIRDGLVAALAELKEPLELRRTSYMGIGYGEDPHFYRYIESRSARIDLSRSLLAGARLEYAELPRVNMSYSFLHGVDLSFANLVGAELTGSQVQGAELSGARLQGADLSEANLQGACMYTASLQHADLSGAKLQSSDLTSATLTDADLSDAELQGADLSEANLEGALLHRANLTNTRLYGVYVRFDDTDESRHTIFPHDTLKVAVFTPVDQSSISSEADARTRALKKWLKKLERKWAREASASKRVHVIRVE